MSRAFNIRTLLNCPTILCWIAISMVVCLCAMEWVRAEQKFVGKLVLEVDVANPTKDKPQSKLWFAHDTWWAWIPTRQGSGVWRRTISGWQRQTALDRSLSGLPGRADVWAEGSTARAVLVDGQRLAVVALKYSAERSSYQRVGQGVQFQVGARQDDGVIETATIARDGRNRWWIAYPWQRRMWVRSSLDADGVEWTEPIAVSREVNADDLCAIVSLSGGVGVIWSDQGSDALYFCWHKNGANPKTWEPIEEIDGGDLTADDHIHAAVSSDGALFLATKNSVDRVDHPQLVLRVRHPDGRWENLPYAHRTANAEPSRPIVLIGGDPAWLFLLHTLYGRDGVKPQANRIVWQSTPVQALTDAILDTTSQSLIGPIEGINNVTGSKVSLPKGKPWIVLASDAAGRVYEGCIEPGESQ
jgi:hypothetical protein